VAAALTAHIFRLAEYLAGRFRRRGGMPGYRTPIVARPPGQLNGRKPASSGRWERQQFQPAGHSVVAYLEATGINWANAEYLAASWLFSQLPGEAGQP